PYPAVPHKRLLRTRRAGTLAEVAAWELRDPRLAALLEGHALAYGLDPRLAPASAAVLPYMEHAFGTWYVRGGMRELARAVYERCLARRVEFVFGGEVVRVLEKDGGAAGVELAGGEVVEADFVVAPGTLAARGEGEPAPQGGLPSRLTVLLALRGGRPPGTAHRTVVHTRDREGELESLFGTAPGVPERPTVTVLRPDDPALVPDGDHEAVTLSAVVPAGAEIREEHVEALLSMTERAVPGLRDRVLWREVRTPADVAAETGAAGGAVPAPALAGAGGRLLHPGNSTGLRGLFTAGGWSHPGGGLPHAGMSGALVAGLIVEGPEFRGSQ
ncbi:phytoene desaturase family protein, partial [Streptomyces sp. NPDC002920]